MWTRPLGDMLTDVAGSLLELIAQQQLVHVTSIELMLPIDARLRQSSNALVFCADVPAWRWQTDWDPPLGQLRFTLEEARQEAEP
jgi:hypothetical protein